MAAHLPWEAGDAVVLAWVRGLLGCGPGTCRPTPVLIYQLSGRCSHGQVPWWLLPSPTLCASGFPGQHLPLRSPVPGAHPEAETNCKWVLSRAVHPAGAKVICGSYDSKLLWFDLDLLVSRTGW